MKKYIFLVKGIEDITGAPRYVNNKCRYLKEHGWEVLVFWSYNVSNAKLEHLIPYDNKEFIVHELQYYPCWFTKRKQKGIVDRISKKIGSAEQIVIESNKIQLGAWGELLASRLHAKHINFVTTEGVILKNEETFKFCHNKLKRHEFFNISASAVKQLFSRFVKLEHPENYYWSAMQNVEVDNYSFPDYDNMPKADYAITSFGRSKGYFPYMLEELESFITNYPEKTFNIFFLGDLNDTLVIREKMHLPNVHLVICPKAVRVVPKQLFSKSDVIIATAGCAYLAHENGGKVISMDIKSNTPLGLLGYTTWDTNTDSGFYSHKYSLSQWLQYLLIEKKQYPTIPNPEPLHAFDYQMSFIVPNDGVYLDSSKVRERITRYDNLLIPLTKLGMFRLVNYLFFKKRGKLSNSHKGKVKTGSLKKAGPCVVEFNGLPGLGKTTVANILIDDLRKDGLMVVNRKYDKNIIWKVLAHFPKLYSPSLYRIVAKYAKTIPSKGNKRTHVDWTNRYAFKYHLINKQNEIDYAIVDEGIIQFLVAMGFQDRMPESDKAVAIVKKIKELGIQFVRVDCVNHVEEAASRIMSRPSRGLVFENMKRDELVTTLETESLNFDYLRKVFSIVYNNQIVIEIDTKKDPYENAMKIKEIIVKKDE